MRSRAGWAGVLGVSLALLAVFWPSFDFSFLRWDDPVNVTENPLLLRPSWASLGQIWNAAYEGLYVPLTYSVWLAVVAIAGTPPSPAVFHGLNTVTHLVNVLLVFAWFFRLLACAGSSVAWQRGAGAAVGALIFAIHPLQVEPVAWVTCFRDLLSATFALLTLHLVLGTADDREGVGEPARGGSQVQPADSGPRRFLAPSVKAQILAGLTFSLALLAKPSVASLPFVVGAVSLLVRREGLLLAVGRAAPFAALSIVAIWVTRQAQHGAGAAEAPLWLRPLVALDALQFYLAKLLWPASLSLDYGRTTTSLSQAGALAWCWVLPLLVLGGAWALRRRWPPALLGAAVFVATLLPTLGLVSFAFQSFSNVADRYAYLALLGPGLWAAFAVQRFGTKALAPLGLALLALGVTCRLTLVPWRGNEPLFTRTLEVSPHSAMAATNLGLTLLERGDAAGALSLFERAVASNPDYLVAVENLGTTLVDLRRYAEAIPHLQRALKQGVPSADLEVNLGAALVLSGSIDEGVTHYRRALELNPRFAQAYSNLGAVELAYGRYDAAAKLFQQAVQLAPQNQAFRRNLERARALGAGAAP